LLSIDNFRVSRKQKLVFRVWLTYPREMQDKLDNAPPAIDMTLGVVFATYLMGKKSIKLGN